jgi:hypothetical protein
MSRLFGGELLALFADQGFVDASPSGLSVSAAGGIAAATQIPGSHLWFFDGADDNITFTSAASDVVSGVPGCTASWWVIPNKISSELIYLSNSATSSKVYGTIAAVTGLFNFGGRSQVGEAFRSASSPSAIPLNVPVMLTGVMDPPNDRIRLYVNGSKVTDAEIPFTGNTVSTGTGTIHSMIGSLFFGGFLNDMRLFGTAFSDAQVAELYQFTLASVSGGFSLSRVLN